MDKKIIFTFFNPSREQIKRETDQIYFGTCLITMVGFFKYFNLAILFSDLKC